MPENAQLARPDRTTAIRNVVTIIPGFAAFSLNSWPALAQITVRSADSAVLTLQRRGILAFLLLALCSSAASAQTLSIKDARVNEGVPYADRYAEFEVTLSAPSDTEVRVRFATEAGTATALRDYADTTALVIFEPGVTSKTVQIQVLDDDFDEPDEETFFMVLKEPSPGITLGRARATATIVDDDTRGLVLSRESLTLTEAPGAGQKATYTVALASEPTADVQVSLNSADTSVATVSPALLTFTAASWRANRTQTVTVTSSDDDIDNDPDRATMIAHAAKGGDYGSVTGSVAGAGADDDRRGGGR